MFFVPENTLEVSAQVSFFLHSENTKIANVEVDKTYAQYLYDLISSWHNGLDYPWNICHWTLNPDTIMSIRYIINKDKKK